jgi:hypothetical protein
VASGKARLRPCRVLHAVAIPHRPRPMGAAFVKLTGCSWSQESLALLWVLRLSHGRFGSEFCWHSSHSLMTFRPLPARASRVSRHIRHPRPKPWIDGHHGLRLSFKALVKALGPPLGGLSSHGIRVSPSRWYTFRASTPRSRSSLRIDTAKRRFTFHPRGFAPPRWFSPRESYGSVAPRNQPRVHRVSCVPPPRSTRRRRGSPGAFPATRFTPFEDFPSPAAVPHHCGRCLPAVTVLPGAVPDRGRCPCRSPHTEARDVHL